MICYFLTIAFVTRIATVTVTWFKGWCKFSPLWQPSMGNATHVEYSNNWNSPLQISLPL